MQNGRVGAFLAVNNGTVKGCVADIAFSAKNGGAGFVYEGCDVEADGRFGELSLFRKA